MFSGLNMRETQVFNLLKGQKADFSGYPHKEVQEHSSDQSPCLFTKMYALVTGKLPVQFSLEKLQTASILFIFLFFFKKEVWSHAKTAQNYIEGAFLIWVTLQQSTL